MSSYITHGKQNAPNVVSRLRLQTDEEIVASALTSKWWTLSAYIFTLGLWSIWRKRHAYILTNQRLVLLKGIISKSQQVVSLNRIQDTNIVTSPFTGGKIMLSTAGGSLSIRELTLLTQQDARDFADAIQEQSHNSTTGQDNAGV